MTAHARFPVDPAARITAGQIDDMAAQLDDSVPYYLPRVLAQAARDARTLERLRAWLEAEKARFMAAAKAAPEYSEIGSDHYCDMRVIESVLAKLDTLERDSA
jgi:hypothetical protein